MALNVVQEGSYGAVVSDFESSAFFFFFFSPSVTATAIWHSPWAQSHYGYGAYLHTGPCIRPCTGGAVGKPGTMTVTASSLPGSGADPTKKDRVLHSFVGLGEPRDELWCRLALKRPGRRRDGIQVPNDLVNLGYFVD